MIMMMMMTMMTMMTNTIPYRRTKTHIWDKVLMGIWVHPLKHHLKDHQGASSITTHVPAFWLSFGSHLVHHPLHYHLPPPLLPAGLLATASPWSISSFSGGLGREAGPLPGQKERKCKSYLSNGSDYREMVARGGKLVRLLMIIVTIILRIMGRAAGGLLWW